MQIHVVQSGQSLEGIAQAYSVPVDQIVQANQISTPIRLVVGQAIVIPIWGRYHWVQPSESLWTISQRYQVSVQELARINQIADPSQIQVGSRLYIPQQRRPFIDVDSYLHTEITGPASVGVVNQYGDFLSKLLIFTYEVRPDGSLETVIDQPIINTAYNKRVAPMMVVSNIVEGQFNTELASIILSSTELQDRLLTNIITIMEEKGYLGVDFDFEYLGAENRVFYNQFIRRASTTLQERGYFLSVALAPKVRADQPGLLVEGHDYPVLGRFVDKSYLMTYEWGWIGGPPMAVAPLNEVRRVIEYAVTAIPRNKIIMGIPLYGYDWTLPYVAGETLASPIRPLAAIELAKQYNAIIQYDPRAQSPFFTYVDEQEREHIVWFEDARSIQAKFNLVKEFNLGGVFYWALGFEFPQNWLLVTDNFIVRKYV